MKQACLFVALSLALALPGLAEEPGKGELSVANPGAPEATGGPDGFGYQYIDSNETTGLPPTYTLIDISTTGTALGLGDDDETNVVIPFAFPFYGVSTTNFRVGNNGGLLVGVTTGDLWGGNVCPQPIGSPNAPLIMAFWDDIDSGTGDVYWQAFDPCPHPDCSTQCAVFEWYNRPHYPNTGNGTFEAILCDNGDILFQYEDVIYGDPTGIDNGISATVGIEDDAQGATYYLPYSCNQAAITDGLAIKYTLGPIPVGLQSFDVE